MSQKKILVTGASGFLGSRVKEYYSRKYQVAAPGHGEMDISDEDSVFRVFAKEKPDVVIHCAAVSDTGVCEQRPELSWRVNVRGSEAVARAARDIGAKCVMCSSDQVYFGSQKPGGHVEEEILSPVNVYGRHKLYAEGRCLEINPDCVMLRLTWMYDPVTLREGEHSDFFRTLCRMRREGQKMAYAVHDMRGLTYVGEVTANLEKAWELPGGVYNFGSENSLGFYDMVEALFQRLNYDQKNLVRDEEKFSRSPRNMSMNIKKIRKYGIDFSATMDGLAARLEEERGKTE